MQCSLFKNFYLLTVYDMTFKIFIIIGIAYEKLRKSIQNYDFLLLAFSTVHIQGVLLPDRQVLRDDSRYGDKHY